MNHHHDYRICITILISIFFLGMTGLSAQELDPDLLKTFTYREIGPTRQGGRYVDFAVPNGQPFTFYTATASGGLWKTTNSGITYESIFEPPSVFSIGDIAVAPSAPDEVWVGTGEGNNSRSVYWGDGIYKSTDAGKTWTNMGLKETQHIGRIVIHPGNPDIVYVAALGHLYSENEERGLYKTIDGGQTWEKVLEIVDHDKTIGVVDVVMNPKNPDVLYAAAYDKVRRPWTFNLGGPGSGIYKTEDGGQTWTQLAGGLPGGMLGRIGLDIYPKNPRILYAIIENANKEGMSDEERYQELLEGKSSRGIIGNEVYRTDDGGFSWRKVSEEKANLGGSPPYYYGQIRVDPNDPDHVYNLMISVAESKDGGVTWERAFRFGGDNHALWIDPENSHHMLLGYDHGMGITYDGGATWFHPDYVSLAQFYAIGIDMERPYNVYGGTQDNGSLKGPSTKRNGGPIQFEDWTRVGGGDGFYNVVDPTDSRWLYNESQFGNMYRRDQVTGEAVNIKPRGRDLRFNWSTPIFISPHNPRTLYVGTHKLMKSTNRGDSWEAISEDLTNPDSTKLTVNGSGGDGNIQYSTITTLDESVLEAGVIWVGTDDGNIQLTRDDGKFWTQLNHNIPDNPGYWVSRVIASQHDTGKAYISYTGFRRDDFRPFVYVTDDYGRTWRSIAEDLPNESINVIREHHANPNLLFVGTDLAVYISIDGGEHWTRMKNNMPTQPVHDLVIHPREDDLVVGTHGRGFFIADIFPLKSLSRKVLKKNGVLFDIEPKVKWRVLPQKVTAYNNFSGQSESRGLTIYYYLKKDKAAEVKIKIFQGFVQINEIAGEDSTGIHKVVWDMTKKRRRTDEEMERFKKRIEGRRELQESDYFVTSAVNPGVYRVVLAVDNKEWETETVILEDEWWNH